MELGNYVELFDLDCTGIGGLYYRFTNSAYDSTYLTWQGNVYTQIPIETSDWEKIGQGSASPKPKLRVSNIGRLLLPAVIALGDLVGAKLIRWRTFQQFLDGQANADPTCYFAPTMYFVEQKTSQNEEFIEWQLSSMLDRQGLRLPREQVLRDVNFPGVSLYRQR